MKDISSMGMSQTATVTSNKENDISLGVIDYFSVECYDSEGNFKWKETIKNLVTNEGLDHVLDVTFKNATRYTTWYVGLKGTGSPLAGDAANQLPSGTMSWTEYEDYLDANNGDSSTTRPVLTLTAVSGQSTSNTGNVAVFTIQSPANDVYGVFITDGQTKGSSSGANILYGVGDFTGGAKTGLASGDTLNVTATLSAASG